MSADVSAVVEAPGVVTLPPDDARTTAVRAVRPTVESRPRRAAPPRRRRAGDDAARGVGDERAAVEDQLVVAADRVAVDDRAARARGRTSTTSCSRTSPLPWCQGLAERLTIEVDAFGGQLAIGLAR